MIWKNKKIKVCEPSLSSLEKKYVLQAIEDNKISSTAEIVKGFEEAFAEKIGVHYAIAVNSGFSALLIALSACGLKEGDEVIVPTFTMIATVNAIVQTGAKPIFIDSEEDTGNIDCSLIEKKITLKTKAILPVHIYGHPCDMDSIIALANKYNLWVIEDAAEAHGAKYKNRMTGSLGDIGCFSFYANKIITTGEGGIITTNNRGLAEQARDLREYYMTGNPHFYHRGVGWNLRMSSLEAALGLAQIQRFDELVDKRRQHAEFYNQHLTDIVKKPIEKDYAFSVYWMYGIRTTRRDALIEYLAHEGIETRTFFIPMHQQPMFRERGNYLIAEKLSNEGLYLPSGSDLTEKELTYICNKINKFYE